MNATVIHSKNSKRSFSRKVSFPLLTIALWALLLYAGIKIVWNYSAADDEKSKPAITESAKRS